MSFRKLTEIEISDLLKSPKKAPKGQLVSYCPFCHDEERKFYINILKEGQLWDCKKCGERGNIFKLLKHLGKLNLILGEKQYELLERLPTLMLGKKNKEVVELPEIDMPIGFKRVFYDEYLSGRGFSVGDYERYPVGVAVDMKFKNYIIFQVFEDGKLFGFTSRVKMSKSEVDSYNKSAKIQNKPQILRWRNSDSDFSKLVYGLDELDGTIDTVIVVESIMGKRNVDRFLKEEGLDLLKCVATFGSKISEYQIEKLILRGVKNVILIFDPDAVNKIKHSSYDLESFFDVEVGVIKEGEDIDNFDNDRFIELINNTVSSFTYFSNFMKCSLKR